MKSLKNDGQTLVEIVIAIGVAVLIITALAQVATTSIRNTSYSQTQNQASRLAQAALEWVRGQRDTGWSNISSLTGTYCLNSLSFASPGNCSGYTLESIFKRELNISGSGDSRDIVVTVYWTDSKGTHQAQLDTILTNWK